MEKTLNDVLEAKLQSILENKKPIVVDAITKAIHESQNIQDYVANQKSINYSILEPGQGITAMVNHAGFGLSKLAKTQFAAKNNIPTKFLNDLADIKSDPWKKELACQIMNEHAQNNRGDKMLIRTYNGMIKGYVSKTYRRFNSSSLYMQFLESCKMVGAEPIDGHVSETKVFIDAIIPRIINLPTEKNGNVAGLFGVRLKNSDYGDGSLEVQGYIMNAVCTNGLVTKSEFRRVHLGRDISKDMELSNATVELDTKAHCSYLNDVIKNTLSADAIGKRASAVYLSSVDVIDLDKTVEKLPKLGMLQEEISDLTNTLILNSSNDGLEGDLTVWKMIQGITAVARDKSKERQVELQEIAGKMFEPFLK